MARYTMDFERPLIELEDNLTELRKLDVSTKPDLVVEIEALAAQIELLRVETYEHLSPWARVQISRHPDRPKLDDYLFSIFADVIELHGDRLFGDDEALFTGLATLGGRRVAVLGHRKGGDTKTNIRRNFGSPHPEGYRKAMRVMRLAEKFGLPVVSFLDTAGAYPGVDDENRGQGQAIAESLDLLSGLRVPVVVIGIGEGGSGGALAIGFGDRLIMLANAYYSVITPESCAAILYKDAGKAEAVAPCLKMTAEDLLESGIADELVAEPLGGAHRDPPAVFALVRGAVERALDDLALIGLDALVAARYERLRGIGHVIEDSSTAP
jgi:acetyl-CoA carboxylase carboxyl transferase subunit alpha